MLMRLDNQMIQRFMSDRDLAHVVAEDGSVLLCIPPPAPIFRDDPGLRMAIRSHERRIIQGNGLFRIDRMTHAELLERCNRWNFEQRWPALAVAESAEADLRQMVLTSMSFPAGNGVTQEIVAEVCTLMICSANASWRWLRGQSVDKQFDAIARELVGMWDDDVPG